MSRVDFEARYRADPDPWDYQHSPYEQGKYEATLEACGHGPFRRALELGGSIGVFAAMLAPRCDRLVSIDGAATAVAIARDRLRSWTTVDVRQGVIPDDLPNGPFDLVVASEILYYLEPPALQRTLDAVTARMAPGARMVAVHWRPGGPERPFTADDVHAAATAHAALQSRCSERHPHYLLDVLERR